MSDNAKQSLEAAQERLLEAELAGDAMALERIVAEDFHGIDPTGSELDKASVISGYTASGFTLDTLRVEDVSFRLFNNVGVASGRCVMKGRTDGEEFDGEFRYRDIYVRRGEEWRVVASQLTPIRNTVAD